MSAGSQTQALLRLMAWMSPAFPIGGFAWSGGLEGAVHDRIVVDAKGLRSWLSTLLRHGSFWNDGVLFCEAWRGHEDPLALREAAALGLALAGSAERHFETLSLGKAFVAAAQAWPSEVFDRLPNELPYPVAVGACGQSDGVAILAGLERDVLDMVTQAVQTTLDDLGTAAIQAEICSLRHEIQHSRLFRS
jgi:urease accessory protein